MNNPTIFISHSHLDSAFGLRLVQDLRARLGEDAVWYDESGGLHGGDAWWDKIVAEITARNTFIVILSPHAVASKWVHQEMSIAFRQHVELGKLLLPVILAACPVREDWRSIQQVRFTGYPATYDQDFALLLDALAVSATQHAPPVAAPVNDPRAQLTQRLTQEINTAFGRENWQQVMQRSSVLLTEAPETMSAALWRERGLAALSLGQFPAALTSLEAALKADPYDIPTLRTLAKMQEANGKPDDILQTLERALSFAPIDDIPTQIALLNDLSGLLERQGRYADALQRAQGALLLAPDDPDCQARVITCRLLPLIPRFGTATNANRWQDALAIAEEALQLAPTDRDWQARKRQAQGEIIMQKQKRHN